MCFIDGTNVGTWDSEPRILENVDLGVNLVFFFRESSAEICIFCQSLIVFDLTSYFFKAPEPQKNLQKLIFHTDVAFQLVA